MQKSKKSVASENTTGAAAIGMKTGDKVPYAEMGYAVPKAKPKATPAPAPSTSEPTTGARAIGLKTGDRVPKELTGRRPTSMRQMLGIKRK